MLLFLQEKRYSLIYSILYKSQNMLIPTSPVLVISDDPKDQSFNTIKVDFAKITSLKSTKQNFTRCPKCKALLTIDDKKYISCKNFDSEGKFIWNCRFCKQQNKSSEIYFVSSNFKHCLTKNESTKIVPPIILFLVDISGSMTSSIQTDLLSNVKQKNQKSSKSLLTAQMKKIIEESVMRKSQIQYLSELHKSFGNKNGTEQKIQHFSKLSFLFSIIEHHLKTLKGKKQQSEYRVGFIFFSDSLIVLKGAKQKSIPMYIHESDNNDQIYPFKKQKIDFNNFKQIFQKGKTYDRYFGDSKFSNFDISKLSVQHVKTGGKTALGPALAFASGIISQHDQGSKVIVVTDSLPNYGILSSKESRNCYKQISEAFKQSKATMGIFRLINNEYEQKKSDAQFQAFIKVNSETIKLIQISITPSINEQVLQNTIKSLRNMITHESVGDSYSLTIVNDNTKITLNKFKYDSIDFRNLRFITSQSKHWIQCSIDRKSLQESDLLFPVMTQLVVEYDDVFTKQRCLFMSYTQQRILRGISSKDKYGKNMQKDYSQRQIMQQFMQQVNVQNLQTMFDLQCITAFEQQRQREDFKHRTYRSELNNRIFNLFHDIIIKSIDCNSVNDYTYLKNKINEDSYEQTTVNKSSIKQEGRSGEEDNEEEEDYVSL